MDGWAIIFTKGALTSAPGFRRGRGSKRTGKLAQAAMQKAGFRPAFCVIIGTQNYTE